MSDADAATANYAHDGSASFLVNYLQPGEHRRQLDSGLLTGHHVIVVDNGDDPGRYRWCRIPQARHC